MSTSANVLPLQGRVAMVTGASNGLGRAMACGLAAAGAGVIVCGRDADRLAETVWMIEGKGGRAFPMTFDVTDAAAVADRVGIATRSAGEIDVLVNNAGEGGPIDSAWEVDPAAWWRTFEINLRGSFLCTHAVLPGMVKRQRGTVINIASHAGVERWPLCSAYSVSKGALVKFTENVAAETGAFGVSVFAVHPGLLAIGMTETLLSAELAPGSSTDKVASWFRRQIASGRSVEPQRGVEMVLALASGRYDSLSGCYLTVDDDLDALARRAQDDEHAGLYRLRIAV